MQKTRLVWVDVAKAIVIILMVIGHSVPFKSTLYVLIFSFHMPFFFIISGYTSRKIKNKEELSQYSKKLATRILFPTILVAYLASFELMPNLKWNSIKDAFLSASKELYWGGTPPSYVHLGVELIWFLIVFFFAKLLFEYLGIYFSDKSIFTMLAFCSFIIYSFISSHHYLPLAIDLVPIATFYMSIGRVFRKMKTKESIVYYFVFSMVFIFWVAMIQQGLFIDMSNRLFPNWPISILETVAGSFVMICFSWSLGEWEVLQKFSLIGKHTLMIMLVHQLDMYSFWHLPFNVYINAGLRVFVDISLSLIVVFIIQKVKEKLV
ncbi:acyltransferase family protein [Lactobacillaceae bacterium 24-114]